MFRPAIGTLIVAAALGIAGQAGAELPMSPVYRTDQTTAAGQSRPRPAEHANPVSAERRGGAPQSAQTVAPSPAKQTPSPQAPDAQSADSAKVIATALIPPPLPSPPPLPTPTPAPAAESPTMAKSSAPDEPAAASGRKPNQAPRRHYATYRYPYLYRSYSAWGGGNPPHLGPNPYSPNGGD